MRTKKSHITNRLLRSLFEYAPKPFGARFEGLSSVLRKASEQEPATVPSEAVYENLPTK